MHVLVLRAPGCLNVAKLSLDGPALLSLQKQRSKGRGASETPAGQAAAQQNGVGPEQVGLVTAEQSKSIYCQLAFVPLPGPAFEEEQVIATIGRGFGRRGSPHESFLHVCALSDMQVLQCSGHCQQGIAATGRLHSQRSFFPETKPARC